MAFIAETVAKKKWKGLRDYYRGEIVKASKHRSGDPTDAVAKSSWPYFSLLAFLSGTMKTRPRESNLELPESMDEFSDTPVYEDTPATTPQSIEGVGASQEGEGSTDVINHEKSTKENVSPRPLVRSSAGKRKRTTGSEDFRRQLLELEHTKLQLLTQEEAEDDDLLFLKSLLADMKSLPRHRKMYVKLQFQQLLYAEVCSSMSSACGPSEVEQGPSGSSSHQLDNYINLF